MVGQEIAQIGQEIKRVLYPVTPEKVGFFVLGIISTILIIIKAMIVYNIGLSTQFYATMQDLVIAIPVFFAIAMVLILLRYMKNPKYLIISFIILLIIGFVFISPILTGGV